MIMRKMLQIGEVAQLLGVTSKTIRHYHKIGLLPEPERTESGYRLYNAQDLLHLKQIRHMQEFGLSLKHIKTLLVHLPPLESPFAEMFGNLISVNISPAQQRFMTEVERRQASIDSASKQ
jgi:DNA-binding transcriptional MerR regulator